MVRGVPIVGDGNPNESRRQGCVDLHQVGTHAEARDAPPSLVAELVVANAGDHGDGGARRSQVTSDVEGRTAEKEAGRQGIPEQLADTEDFAPSLW